MRSAKRAFAVRADSNRVIQENLRFSMCYLYKTKEKAGKNTGQKYRAKTEVKCKNEPYSARGGGGGRGGGDRKRTC